MAENEIVVSILCTAFNHEKYIAQCLDSLLSQKTTFQYEIIVHDDASTDHTADIIREYEKKANGKIVAIYQQENQFSKHIAIVPTILLPMARGKYLATCECDDFWTCDDKLQKQVDFLESHPDYVMCTHAAYYANENGKLDQKSFFTALDHDSELTMEDILSRWCFATNSRLIRKEVFPHEKPPYQGKCVNGDFAMAVYLALRGRVYYINQLMCAYRQNSVSSLSVQNKKNKELAVQRKQEFINMLTRIDDYTGSVYHTAIEKHKEEFEFSILVSKGEYKKALQMKEQVSGLSFAPKCWLAVRAYFPVADKLANRLRGIRG